MGNYSMVYIFDSKKVNVVEIAECFLKLTRNHIVKVTKVTSCDFDYIFYWRELEADCCITHIILANRFNSHHLFRKIDQPN